MKPRDHGNDPIDGLLREAFQVADPSKDDLALAEQAYLSRIDGTARVSRRSRPRRSQLVLASAIAVVVAVLVAVQLTRPPAAAVALSEIAEASRLVEPLTIPSQSFAYTKSESVVLAIIPREMLGDSDGDVAYLLPAVHEVWNGADGVVRIQRTVGIPRFFDPEVEEDYYTNGVDVTDGVGETRIETATGVTGVLDERNWPTDPDQLEALLVSIAPEPERRAQLALALIRETAASPQLRAAVLQAMGRIETVVLVGEAEDRYVFEFDLALGAAATRYRFTLTSNGTLLAESETLQDDLPELGIATGTVINDTTYTQTIIVDSLPDLPDGG